LANPAAKKNAKIRAALLGSRGVPAKYGAFETLAHRIATLGGQENIKWVIYCPAENNPPKHYGLATTVLIRRGKGPIASFLYELGSLWHACLDRSIDAIVMLGYGPGLFLILPRLFNKKLITNTDGFEYRRSKWPAWAKLYLRSAEFFAAYLSDKLICDSRHIVNHYREKYKKESTFIAYGTDIPEGLEDKTLQSKFNQFLSQYNLRSAGYHVVVMRLEPENSIKEICEAGVRRESGKPILIIGPSTPFFDKEVRPLLPTNSKVIVAGGIYDRGLLYLLRQNACSYIHGHTVGGINPTLVEALNTGTPVIAQKTLFNEEVLQEAGLYFTDTDSLCRHLDFLENASPETWLHLAAQVKTKLQPYLTWEFIIQEYENLVNNALKESNLAFPVPLPLLKGPHTDF